MLLACFLPLLPSVISKVTFWPSCRLLNPAMLMAEKWAKRSSPPSSGVMKPKPFASLNHLTVPFAMLNFLTKNDGWKTVKLFEFQDRKWDRTWQNQHCRYFDSNTRTLFTLGKVASSSTKYK